MRVLLRTPFGVKQIVPKEVESGDVFIGEPMTAEGLTDIHVTYTNGATQRYTAQSYKIAKIYNTYYPCILPFTQSIQRRTRRHLPPRRTKASFPTRRFRKF